MKRLKLFFACLLMAVLSIGQVWGAAITVNANPTTSGTFTISAAQGSGQNAPIVTGTGTQFVRLYANNTLTISTSGSANITAMTIAWTKNGSKAFATVTTGTGSYTHPSAAGNGTWSGSAKEIVFNVGSSGQIQITSVDITVEEGGKTLSSIAVGGNPTTDTYDEGDAFDPAGLTVTGTYSDASQETISSGITWTACKTENGTYVALDDASVALAKEETGIYVKATANEITSAAFHVTGLTVNEHTVTPGTYDIIFANAFWGTSGTGSNAGHTASGKQNDISVSINGNSGTQNYINDNQTRIYGSHTLTFSVPSGYVLKEITGLGTTSNSNISVASGSTGTITNRVWTGSANSVTFDIGGRTDFSTVNVTYEAESGDVIVKTLKSIVVTGMTTSYEVGDAFSFDGTCTATYSVTKNGDPQPDEDKEVTPTSVTDPDMTSTGGKTITVTYEENEVSKSTTYDITVAEAPSKSTLDFEEKYATGGATADDGAVWTVTSDGTESQFDNTSGIHYGTNSAEVTYLQLATSDISGTISKVVVNARDAQANATITVTVGGVAFTCTGSATATNTSTNYTFTGSGSGEIVVRVERTGSMTKAIYVKTIVVSYEADASAPAVTIDPTAITLATPDAANGTIDATYTNVTLASVTVGRYNDEECTKAFTGDWLTATLNGDKDIEYAVAANTGEARTAYIKLTAPASNGTSPDVVKVIEVAQARAIPTYTSLSALFDDAGSDAIVKIVFDDCVISGKKDDNTAYLTDKNNTYGLVIYTTNHGFNVGDVLNGTVQTTLCKFNGNSELKGLTSTTDGLTVTTGGTITPRVVGDPTTLTGANAGSVIKITGSCTSESSKYYVANVQLFDGLSSGYTTPTVGDQYHCTGVFLMYNSTKEILPRQASELEHIDVPTAVITFNDFSIEKGQNITLSATVAPAAAESATVTYSIVDGGEYVSLDEATLTANEIGVAHILATVGNDLPNYYGATKQITVNVVAPDSRYKAEQTGFDATAGALTTVTEGTHKNKQYISYEGKKGNAANAPAIYDTDKIRLYQNGGLLVIGATKGCKIDQVFLTTGGAYNSTTIGYSTSETSIVSSGDAVAKNTEWHTANKLNTDTVVIVCLGTDKNTRLDVAKIDVRYTGDPISVTGIAVSGTYQTEFTKNSTFNHTDVVVTATYSDASHGDVSTLAEFSEPDMTTTGVKTITVTYGGQSTTYEIEVVNPTVTGISLSGTYPTRFDVGDAFSHTGMTVTAEFSDFSEDNVTDDATFTGYNMSAGGVQTVTVSYGGESATYSIIVAPANTDVMVATDLVATNTQYKDFSGVTDLGTDAIYAGTNAKNDAGAIQLRTSDSKSGIVVTTANTGKIVKSVSIAYQTAPTNERKLQVYGKHTAYTSSENLYSNDAAVQGALIGEIAADGSLDCTINEEYEYIGLRSSDGAIYVAAIMVEWAEATPATYAVTYVSAHGTAPDAETAASVTLGELTEEGWTHNGWVANVDVEVESATVTAGTLIANGTEVVLSTATEFTAQWTENPAPTYVAKIGETMYESLPAAVAAAQDDDVVELLMDVAAGPGVMIAAAQAKQITIDFGGFTYCATSPAVGSAGTQNQAFHFEKGCNITLQNGTITSSGNEIIMLIQNYGDLTLKDITLIGNNLPGTHRYVLSNNCGDVVIGDGTKIKAKEGDVAFDVCVTNYYPEGTTVTVKEGATITGIVEYDVWGQKPAENKATLTIEGGEFAITWNVEPALAEDAKDNINVSGGTFNAEVPADYCAHGYIPEDNGNGQYGVYYAGYYERGSLTPGNYATICLPNGGKISGASLFDIEYYENSTLYLLEVEGNAMVAGRPYIFLPSSNKIEVTYTDAANEPAGSFHGLVGSYTQEEIAQTSNNYILYNNQYWLVNSVAYVGANRAYIHMDDVPTEPTPQVGNASRRRIAMTVNGEQTATGMDALNASENPVKVLRDGQIFILRGEKMYDVTGQMVK